MTCCSSKLLLSGICLENLVPHILVNPPGPRVLNQACLFVPYWSPVAAGGKMSIMVLTRPSDNIEENKEVLLNCVNRAFKLCFLCVFYILQLQREDTNNIEPYYI